MAKPLETVLADALAETDVIERAGSTFSHARVRAMLAEIQSAAEPYVTWLSESDAAIRAGRTVEWMRARFPAMQREENAKLDGRARRYRQCAVPRRAQTEAVAARARDLARQEKKAS